MRVFLDTETTGFQPGQIAQLAYIVTDDQLQPILANNFYFQVDSMDWGATATHGLTRQSLRELSGGRRFTDQFAQLCSEIADHPLICHNVAFDQRFLSAEYYRLGRQYRPRSVFCTMLNLAAVCGKRPKLEEAVRHFSIRQQQIVLETQRLFCCNSVGAHDARYDITATFLVARQAHSIITPWINATAATSDQIPGAASEVAATRPES